MSISPKSMVHITDKKVHERILKDYVDEHWKDRDVQVDWEWSGPGMYRIHEHMVNGPMGNGLPCVSLKWEGV